jgi:hypothetical protein
MISKSASSGMKLVISVGYVGDYYLSIPMLTIIAIWDNRSVFHCATFDFDGFGDRSGNRAVGVGEVPYFDPNSKSRREDLGIEDTIPPFHW